MVIYRTGQFSVVKLITQQITGLLNIGDGGPGWPQLPCQANSYHAPRYPERKGSPQPVQAGNSTPRTTASGAAAPTKSASRRGVIQLPVRVIQQGITKITSASCPKQKNNNQFFFNPSTDIHAWAHQRFVADR